MTKSATTNHEHEPKFEIPIQAGFVYNIVAGRRRRLGGRSATATLAASRHPNFPDTVAPQLLPLPDRERAPER